MTNKAKKARFLAFMPAHFSYATCFRAIFILFGTAGLMLGLILCWKSAATPAVNEAPCPCCQREK